MRLLLILLLSISTQFSSAQTLSKYTDQLYFGLLSLKPDSAVLNFLTRYVPVMLVKFDSSVKWTAYPPGPEEEPKYYKVSHGYIFNNHPFVKAHFKSGQLTIIQKVYDSNKWIDNILDVQLWFEFDAEKDAKTLLKELIDKFLSLKVLNKITSKGAYYKAEFTDKKRDKYPNSIQVIYTTDYTLSQSKMMVTKSGVKTISQPGYKIVVQLGNELF